MLRPTPQRTSSPSIASRAASTRTANGVAMQVATALRPPRRQTPASRFARSPQQPHSINGISVARERSNRASAACTMSVRRTTKLRDGGCPVQEPDPVRDRPRRSGRGRIAWTGIETWADKSENDTMCNRYVTPDQQVIEQYWHIGGSNPPKIWAPIVYPRAPGPFMRSTPQGRELVVGQWALIPPFAKGPRLPYSTNNARAEELAHKPSYRQAWAQGQRCIIPAASFDEPCWETGKNVWWRFWRTDTAPWGLAGLWNTWLDRSTGEIVESYTMLTVNADHHPLMRRMHKPDPAKAAHEQDKRSVIPIERENVDQWLSGNENDARALLRLPNADVFDAHAMEPGPATPTPGARAIPATAAVPPRSSVR